MKPAHCAAVAVFVLALTAAGTPLLAQGAATATDQQAGPVVTETRTTTATVETIDQEKRTVLLRTGDGTLLTVQVGPEVRNLAQVRPGDRVTATYRESVAAAISRPDSPPLTAGASVTRAVEGERPAGETAQEVTARVRILAVDTRANTVTFLGPSGLPRIIALRDPGMQRFAATLQPGDDVDVTYTEALAIRVDPAPR
ncbi:conserved exported protein of unknown function [Rhodovastum atsumiense]|uniref:Copper-binding protein n=1 Tax=Rhodovastum atsumiense TaxID=504468 RepID=A0A5M6ILS1_9PROT|nr:hypothetical protein [Rhodovastum atsumiense]KAA5609204.1 hypothetical protein F1189_25240 [Rhodovastum atsumiense]CAH2603969.1 conserved exported protein of unknown function [Rhodovastum atsumiense]